MSCAHPPERWHVDLHTTVCQDDATKPIGTSADHFFLDVSVTCGACGEPMHFLGDFDLGVRFDRPTVDFNRTKISLALAPGRAPKLSGVIAIPRIPTVKT